MKTLIQKIDARSLVAVTRPRTVRVAANIRDGEDL